MSADVISLFSSKRVREPVSTSVEEDAPAKVDWRSRERVLKDIDAHEKARKVYQRAVAWTVAAEAENLPRDQIEEALKDTAAFYEEMQEAARHLVICMPADPKGLVDLLMYLEKNFSILPEEIRSQSLALYMLRTVRLSLRGVTKYGKRGWKRRRRSHWKRNRQRLRSHHRRLHRKRAVSRA
jgi:hypothetical protein